MVLPRWCSRPRSCEDAPVSRLRTILTDRRLAFPFFALLVFYTLVNLAAKTTGQFGTYVAVNVVGISVQTNSLINLLTLPVGILLGFWFMRIVDEPRRMAYYAFGAIASTLGLAALAIFVFSLLTLVLIYAGAAIGYLVAWFAFRKRPVPAVAAEKTAFSDVA